MSRYIDAVALSETFGIGRDCDHCQIGREKCEEDAKLSTIEICGIIADAEESAIVVVRCEDCVHWEQNEQNDDGICRRLQRRTTPGWYCADGEDRK